MIFHLAIPARDIPEAIAFYSNLGTLGRHEETWAIFNIKGMQLVCHKAREIPEKATMYPRHFGFIVEFKENFESFYAIAVHLGLEIFEKNFTRFKGQHSEHETFFLKDPSNNVIEFKWYKNKDAIFGI